jgi:hypothetical protein
MLRFIAFFLLFSLSLGDLPASAADPVYPLGSRMGFVPPAGFIPSKRFPGFEHPDTNSTMVLATLPSERYGELEASISSESLKKQGVTEEKRETLTLAHGKALLVTGSEQDKEGKKLRKWMFLGQVPEGVALVAVLVPEPGLKTFSDAMIRTSLTSLTIRPSVPMAELVSLMPFKLNDMSGLKPVRLLGNTGLMLTLGDKDVAMPTDQPFFAVMIGEGGPEQAPDRANFARNLFSSVGDVKDVHILSGDMLKLGGGALATHEIQAEAKEAFSDTPMKLVQWVRFSAGEPRTFIRMLGIARADQWTAAFPHFRAVRDGVGPQDN